MAVRGMLSTMRKMNPGSESSLHSDILSHILNVARIVVLDTQEEAPAPAPTQDVWVSISHTQPSASIPVAENYSQMLRKAWNHPKAAPQFNAGYRRFVKLNYALRALWGTCLQWSERLQP